MVGGFLVGMKGVWELMVDVWLRILSRSVMSVLCLVLVSFVINVVI